MKQRSGIELLAVVGLAALGAAVGIPSCRNDDLVKLERTHTALRTGGFELEVTNFDLTISPEGRTRAEALDACGKASYLLLSEAVDWLPTVGTNAALVMWDEPGLVADRCTNLWIELRRTLNHAALAQACEALLSGPYRSLPPVVKGNGLSFTGGESCWLGCPLGAQAMLALHERDRPMAWTNLLAFTRLVAEWQPEQFAPNMFYWRHTDLARAYGVTWQALQAGGWTDAQLAAWQREWETASASLPPPTITHSIPRKANLTG